MPLKATAFDPADYLRTPDAIAAYLEEAFESGDPAFIADALGVAARAKGMAQVARDAGLGRESLYKALSSDGHPELATVLKVIRALGLRLYPGPLTKAKRRPINVPRRKNSTPRVKAPA